MTMTRTILRHHELVTNPHAYDVSLVEDGIKSIDVVYVKELYLNKKVSSWFEDGNGRRITNCKAEGCNLWVLRSEVDNPKLWKCPSCARVDRLRHELKLSDMHALAALEERAVRFIKDARKHFGPEFNLRKVKDQPSLYFDGDQGSRGRAQLLREFAVPYSLKLGTAISTYWNRYRLRCALDHPMNKEWPILLGLSRGDLKANK